VRVVVCSLFNKSVFYKCEDTCLHEELMAGLYHTSDDVKWSNIRAAERREEAEWLSGAEDREREHAKRERAEWFHKQAANEKAKKLAEKMSRKRNFEEASFDLSQAMILSPADLHQESEILIFTETLLRNLDYEIYFTWHLFLSVFSPNVLGLACFSYYLSQVMFYFLDLHEVIGIAIIVGSTLNTPQRAKSW
jgi:hypothetical protein